jgi:chromosome partitioning protein
MRVISISNQKGGAGKTTTAVHTAVALTSLGKRVLLIDIDGQGNSTAFLGLEKDGQPLMAALSGAAPLSAAITETEHGIDVITGGPALAGIDVMLYSQKQSMAAHQLKRHLDKIVQRWDFVLIDTPPNLGTATISALLAASEVLIPVQTEAMAFEALLEFETTLTEIQQVNKALRIIGVLACMSSSRESLSLEVELMLRKHYKRLVFQSVIKRNTRLANAYAEKKPVHLFDPRNESIAQFKALAKELIARGKKKVAA